MEEIRIQVKYTEQTEYGPFTSALYYTLDEWQSMSDEQRAQDKQRQIDAFVAAIQNPAVVEVPEELTPEEQYQRDMEARAREAGLV